jgi:hypothetical protein
MWHWMLSVEIDWHKKWFETPMNTGLMTLIDIA